MTAATLNALDLSNFTGAIDAATVACWKADGVRKVIIGCQDVTIALRQAEVCSDGGLAVELYAFLYFGLSVMPEVQKALTVAANAGLGPTLIWLDCEATPPNEAKGQTPATRVQQLQAAVDKVTGSGGKAGIYTGEYYWKAQMGNCTDFKALPLWHAAYFDDGRLIDTVSYGGWTAVAIHQYAGSATLCGKSVDLDDDLRPLSTPQEDDDMADAALKGEFDKLNEAATKRFQIIAVASGDYQTAMNAWDALKAAGLVS